MAPESTVKVTFIAKVELIELHQEHSSKQTGSVWWPPVIPTAFTRGNPRLFKWNDGTMHTFTGQCPEADQRYSAATIFSQGQSSALLSVMCDAGAQSVTGAWGWRSLGFEAAPAVPTLSRVGPTFKNETLRSPGGQPLVGQLLPSCYHCPGSFTSRPPITGLTGDLPILIALAALSTSKAKMKDVLSESIQGYRLIPHQNGQERLRSMYDLDRLAR